MIRLRLSACFLLLSAGLLAGCGRKSDTDSGGGSGPNPASGPGAPTGEAEKTGKEEAVKRLTQIGKAMHQFENAFGYFPAGIVGPKNELGLSWRVQLLPYLGEGDLFKQFNLEEAWDSPHNKALLAKMPKVYESPGKPADAGMTHLLSFFGENAFLRPLHSSSMKPNQPSPSNFEPGKIAPGRRITEISDGTGNTLMVVEAQGAVEWTKPEDMPFVPFGRGMPAVLPLGGPFRGGFHGLMCDGSVRFFASTVPEKVIGSMITIHGGEVLDGEVAGIQNPPKASAKVPSSVPWNLADAAARKTAVANYQKILKGLHDFNDAMQYLPAGIAANKTVGLSWRVQVLPYLGEEKLYKEFKLTEPWDSEHNKRLIERMPAAFASPGKSAPKGHTFVRTTQGMGGIIRTMSGPKGEAVVPLGGVQPGQPVRGRPLIGIVDGTSNTILFVEASDAVPWTKPEELPFAGAGQPVIGAGGIAGPPKNAQVPSIGGVFADGFHAAMADGRVTFFKADYPTVELAKLLCPDDGWVVDPLGPTDKILYSIPPLPSTSAGKGPPPK